MKHSQEMLEFLQPRWREADGDVRKYAAEVHRVMRDLTSENQKLLLQMAIAVAQLPPRKPKEGDLRAESIVSGRDREPYVCISFAGERIQMSPEDARQHAHQVMIAADAAESDAFLVKFLQDRLGLNAELIGNILVDFRYYRERKIQ